jgi:hypothetical protein
MAVLPSDCVFCMLNKGPLLCSTLLSALLAACVLLLQLVEHAFSQDELNGKSIWQQCCVAAVLDGEMKRLPCACVLCLLNQQACLGSSLPIHTS